MTLTLITQMYLRIFLEQKKRNNNDDDDDSAWNRMQFNVFEEVFIDPFVWAKKKFSAKFNFDSISMNMICWLNGKLDMSWNHSTLFVH